MIDPRPGVRILLLSFLLLCSCSAQIGRKVAADSITLPAESLPEFKTDPHVKESQGNQISGVVRTIFQDKRGNLWFGTQDGAARYDGSSLVYFGITNDHGQGITVKAIVEDPAGQIWIGHTGGVTKYDGTSFTSYSEQDGLISNDVWSLAADRTGTLWIGTLDGACSFDGKAFTRFTLPDAAPDPTRGVTSSRMVHFILEDGEGQLWFGTNGGAYCYDGRTLTNLSMKDGLCGNAVDHILQDRRGDLWFGTVHHGACRFDGTTFTAIADHGGGPLLEDASGAIWSSAKGATLYRHTGSAVAEFNATDGLATHAIMCLFEDAQGRIWISGFGGAYRYDPSAVRVPGEPSIVNVSRDGPW